MIYVISDGIGHLKIGKSKNPFIRLQELQIAQPNTLILKYVLDIADNKEKILHKCLHKYHTRGEWYQDNQNVHQYLFLMSRGYIYTLDENGKLNPYKTCIT